jgi:hypothetical protein
VYFAENTMDFRQYYRTLFDTFGYPLRHSASVADKALAAAARSLGIAIPRALRDYYSVAGREKRLNRSFNRLLSIGEWHIDSNRLIFMEGNQGEMLWGVSVGKPKTDDPPVYQSVSGDELQWFRDSPRCSTFLAVILHYQAVSGGFKHCAMSSPPEGFKRRLKSGWRCYGTVNRLAAYSRQNQVVCVEPEIGILAAGKTHRDLCEIESELELELC